MQEQEVTPKKQLYYFALFFVLYESITYLSNDMIMPGMLDVVKSFKADLSFVAFSLTVFILGNTAFQLFIGPTADRFGKRKVLLIGNIMFLIFTAVIATSTNIQQFITGRFLQGSGCAFVAIGYALIHEKFNDKDAVKLTALMGNITILAPLLGPVLGVFIIGLTGWRSAFIIIAAAAIVTLFGLIKYTPKSYVAVKHKNLTEIIQKYLRILYDKVFITGTLSVCCAIVPIIAWIGISPVVVMQTAKLGYTSYLIYQVIAMLGLSISSIIMQFIAGKLSFQSIMKSGMLIFGAGAVWSLAFYWNPLLFSIGFFISGLGIGFYNGMALRVIISNHLGSQSMTMSLLIFIESLAMAAGVEIVNLVCGYFTYSFLSFAAINFIISAFAFFFIAKFIKLNRDKTWE